MKRLVFTFLGLSLFGAAAFAQQALSIEEAIATGLENNLSIRISRKAVEIDANNYDKSIGGLLPVVSVTANRNFSNTNVEQQFVNDDEPRTINGAKSNTFDLSPTLRWTIFNGLGMFATRDRLEEQERLSNDALRVVIENNIASISSAYYQVVLEKERLRVFQDALQLSEDRVDFAKTRYEVGKSSKLDYLQAQVDYNTDKSNLIAQQELIYNVQVDLNRLMGSELEQSYQVAEDFDLDTTLVLEPLLASSALNNPGIIRAQRARDISYIQQREIRAERYPVINLNLGYNYNNRNSDAGFLISNTSKGLNYGVSASLNIFNGFDLKRREQNNKIQIESNELAIEDLKQQLEADIRKTYVNYQNSIRLKDLEEQNFEVAKENYDIALERYKLGNSNAIELREAQVNLVQAEIRKITSQYAVKVAEIELTRLAGYNLMEE